MYCIICIIYFDIVSSIYNSLEKEEVFRMDLRKIEIVREKNFMMVGGNKLLPLDPFFCVF